MQELAMHVLDVVENSLTAGATRIAIRIQEDLQRDLLVMEVQDNGKGIPPAVLSRVTEPFTTSRSTRSVGLGLALLKAAAERCQGFLEIHSLEGEGTTVTARFQLNHFDRAPIGNMGETMGVLVTGNPRVDFTYEYRVDGKQYTLATSEMRKVLAPVGLDDPAVFQFVRQDVQNGLEKIGAATFPKIKEVLR